MQETPDEKQDVTYKMISVDCQAIYIGETGRNLNIRLRELCGRRGGLMVSALDSGASAPGSSPGRGHCFVFLGKTFYSHGASLHPGV